MSNRYPRYKEPVFSRKFTMFLIALAVIAAGFVVYIVFFTYPGMLGVGRAPAEIEYEPSDISNNEPDDYYINQEDLLYNAYEDEINDPPEETYESNGDSNYNNENLGEEIPNYDPYEYYGPYEPYEPYEPYVPFILLTSVDNSLLPWYLKLVNRYNFLDYYFLPYLAPIGWDHYFDARAYRSLLDMLDSARAEGLSPIVASSFRSVSRQTTLFRNQVQRHLDRGYSEEDAFEQARRVVAYPGTSEHNLGLAVDIVALSYQNLTANQANTPEGIWLAENSYRYGFVLRYPYHKQDITNIIFEPWHFRYVGRYAAAEMFYRDLVLEEYVSELLAGR